MQVDQLYEAMHEKQAGHAWMGEWLTQGSSVLHSESSW